VKSVHVLCGGLTVESFSGMTRVKYLGNPFKSVYTSETALHCLNRKSFCGVVVGGL
jgi:hypothetical protein